MRLIIIFGALLLCSVCYGQKDIGALKLDSTFGINGMAETSTEGIAKLTASDIPGGNIPSRKLLIAGEITSESLGIHSFGMFQYDAEGIPDQQFGTNGKAFISFGTTSIDYPNCIRNYYLPPYFESAIIAAGISSTDTTPLQSTPALFRFNGNGEPDSNFGMGGRIKINFGENYVGEFTNFDRITKGQPGYVVACGYINRPATEPNTAFATAWITNSGLLDSGYGNNGIQLIPAPIKWATGFYTQDRHILFVGLSNASKPEIILCRLTSSGQIDSEFGINGILNTGILLKQGTSSLPSTYYPLDNAGRVYVLAFLDSQTDLPFTLIRFNVLNGLPDPTFGQNGIATAPILSSISGLGISISPDGSSLVSGRSEVGNGACAIAKFLINGSIDTTFGNNGVAIVDIDNGTTDNYLTNLNTIGKQLFIGAGVKDNHSKPAILLTRFKPVVPKNNVAELKSDRRNFFVFPNPCTDFIQLRTEVLWESISITNYHGATVRTFALNSTVKGQNVTIDVSNLASGTYFLVMKSKSGVYSEKFEKFY